MRSRVISSLINADITKEFVREHTGHPTERVWVSPGEGKFVSVLRRGTDDSNYWYYTQRRGKDSVAFLFYNSEKADTPYMCLTQYNGAHAKFTTGAFTGSVDKAGLTLSQIVIEEALEEAGYTVDESNIQHLSSDIIGSSNDEVVHMFVIDVTGIEQGEFKPENIWEENTEFHWMSPKEICTGNEIKAKSIVLSHILQKSY